MDAYRQPGTFIEDAHCGCPYEAKYLPERMPAEHLPGCIEHMCDGYCFHKGPFQPYPEDHYELRMKAMGK